MALGRLSLFKSREFLNESSAEFDTALKALLEIATTHLEKQCARQLVSASVTEYLNGHDEKKLYLHEYPVSTITSIKIWDTGDEAYETETSTYYQLRDGAPAFVYYPKLGQESNSTYSSWPDGEDYIEAIYVAGYVTTNWDTQTVTVNLQSLTTAPAVGDVLTQDQTGGTITVTAASVANNTVTGTPAGALSNDNATDNTFTSNNVGATMAPATVTMADGRTAQRIEVVLPSFAVPTDLEYATCSIAQLLHLEGKGGGARLGMKGTIVGEGMSDVIERRDSGVSAIVEQVIADYTRPRW